MRAAAVMALAALAVLTLAGASACTSGSDFPDPSNPVASIPWPDYELLRYQISDQTGTIQGTLELEVERRDDTYRMRVLFLLTDQAARDETLVTVDAATLRPLRYERLAEDADDRIEVNGVYRVEADGTTVLDARIVENGDVTEQRLMIGDFAFDNDSSAWLWRSLPFAQDFEVTYRSVNVFQRRSQLVSVRVVGTDLVATPAGEFVSWQVAVRPGQERQNLWYERDVPHRLVQWDQQPRRFRLVEVRTQRVPRRATDG